MNIPIFLEQDGTIPEIVTLLTIYFSYKTGHNLLQF